jgi:hypothetical protein
MGRYIILLTAPLIIGALIAAGIIVLSAVRRRSVDNELRRRRIEARRTMLAAKRQADAPFAADPAVTEQPSHRAQPRIAS